MELSLDFFKVRITIPAVVRKSGSDDTTISDNPDDKRDEREIVKPTGYETPPNLRKISTFLGLFVFLVGIIFNWILFKPDKAKISSQWIDECIISLNRQESEFQREEQQSHWRSNSSIWPPKESVIYIVSTPPLSNDINLKEIFISNEKSGLAGKKNT